MDIGGELRAARQARSRSIADIASVTKISPRVLRAIEINAFDTVPRGPFMRGYLTAYAREVGLDADDLLRRYREEFDALPPPSGEAPAIAADGPIGANDPSIASSPSHFLQVGVIVIVALVYLASQRHPGLSSDHLDTPVLAETSAPAAAAPIAAPAEVPVGTSGTSSPKAGQLAIDIQAKGPCWVDATVDGTHLVARLMTEGDHQTIAVQDGLVLRVGDPAVFAFTIDGAAGRTLGPEGRPVTVHIDRGNYRTFLAE